MPPVTQVTNYVIARIAEDKYSLSLLKLQKILYYIQAWHLVYFDGVPMFENDFQAWVHGPVCREVYDRFNINHRLYDNVTLSDIGDSPDVSEVTEQDIDFINAVLDVYAKYSGAQLEQLTHSERPWLEARGNLSPAAHCENIISRVTMRNHYSARVSKNHDSSSI